MSFWEQFNASELVIVKTDRLPQDAPAECATCGVTGPDVILAVCEKCQPVPR